MKTELFDIFTPQQLQAIKDAIIYGAWGDTSQEFYGKDSQLSETHYAWGFCTNDIYKGKLIEEFRKGIIVKLKYVEKRVLDTFKENGVDLDNYTHCVIVKRNFYLA